MVVKVIRDYLINIIRFTFFCIGGLQGHGHWVNSLALSTEYVLRTGAFDHTRKTYSSPAEMKEVLYYFSSRHGFLFDVRSTMT